MSALGQGSGVVENEAPGTAFLLPDVKVGALLAVLRLRDSVGEAQLAARGDVPAFRRELQGSLLQSFERGLLSDDGEAPVPIEANRVRSDFVERRASAAFGREVAVRSIPAQQIVESRGRGGRVSRHRRVPNLVRRRRALGMAGAFVDSDLPWMLVRLGPDGDVVTEAGLGHALALEGELVRAGGVAEVSRSRDVGEDRTPHELGSRFLFVRLLQIGLPSRRCPGSEDDRFLAQKLEKGRLDPVVCRELREGPLGGNERA